MTGDESLEVFASNCDRVDLVDRGHRRHPWSTRDRPQLTDQLACPREPNDYIASASTDHRHLDPSADDCHDAPGVISLVKHELAPAEPPRAPGSPQRRKLVLGQCRDKVERLLIGLGHEFLVARSRWRMLPSTDSVSLRSPTS